MFFWKKCLTFAFLHDIIIKLNVWNSVPSKIKNKCGSAGTGRQARLRGVCPRRTGSSPVCRTKEKPETTRFQGFFFCLFLVLCVVCALLIFIQKKSRLVKTCSLCLFCFSLPAIYEDIRHRAQRLSFTILKSSGVYIKCCACLRMTEHTLNGLYIYARVGKQACI